jgi:maleylacetoacetate isomerase
MMKLYHYWRSSSSWRVRWALEFKKTPCEFVHVNLLNGEADSPEHLKRHPAGFVPVLETNSNTNNGEFLIESLAIISYLEDAFPASPSLYPKDPIEKSRALALAEVVNAGTQPLQNIPVLTFHSSEPEKQKAWAQHWIHHGLELYENLLPNSVLTTENPFSIPSGLSIADIFLMPQLYNAQRYEVSLSPFPKIQAIQKHLEKLDTYQRSHADRYKPAE